MTANENRSNKGKAYNILENIGYVNISVTDSGDNIIVITDTEQRIDRLSELLIGTIYHTNKKGINRFFISLGKRNLKLFKKLSIYDSGGE